MMSQLKPCDDGLPPGVEMISLQEVYSSRKRQRSVTESAQNISREISNDRSLICNNISQNMRLSAGSTGNVESLLPFWNGYTREESKRWWLPEKTDCVVSDQNLWSESLGRTGLGSWFLVQTLAPLATLRLENSQRTCLPSSQCLWRDITDYAQLPTAGGDERPSKKTKTSKEPAAKVRYIRFFPNEFVFNNHACGYNN